VHVEAAPRAVEDEVFEPSLEGGLGLQELEPKHLGGDRDRVIVSETGLLRSIELAVVRGAHRLVLADAMQVKPRAISEPQEFRPFASHSRRCRIQASSTTCRFRVPPLDEALVSGSASSALAAAFTYFGQASGAGSQAGASVPHRTRSSSRSTEATSSTRSVNARPPPSSKDGTDPASVPGGTW
jgi:hypothetical protein